MNTVMILFRSLDVRVGVAMVLRLSCSRIPPVPRIRPYIVAPLGAVGVNRVDGQFSMFADLEL
jgi:hypothetical protein